MNRRELKALSIPHQIERYLLRLRGAVPFPRDSLDTFNELFPAPVSEWYSHWRENKGCIVDRTGRTDNMMPKGAFRKGGAVNICIMPLDKYRAALTGGIKFERVFWMEVPPWMEGRTITPFVLPMEHPQFAAIDAWEGQASEVEYDINTALNVLRAYADRVSTLRDVRDTWPELANFVHLPLGRPMNMDRRMTLKRTTEVITRYHKDEITDLLATAAMLPEETPISAWCGFHVEGTDTP